MICWTLTVCVFLYIPSPYSLLNELGSSHVKRAKYEDWVIYYNGVVETNGGILYNVDLMQAYVIKIFGKKLLIVLYSQFHVTADGQSLFRELKIRLNCPGGMITCDSKGNSLGAYFVFLNGYV